MGGKRAETCLSVWKAEGGVCYGWTKDGHPLCGCKHPPGKHHGQPHECACGAKVADTDPRLLGPVRVEAM